jgi:hypothetical protein
MGGRLTPIVQRRINDQKNLEFTLVVRLLPHL